MRSASTQPAEHSSPQKTSPQPVHHPSSVHSPQHSATSSSPQPQFISREHKHKPPPAQHHHHSSQAQEEKTSKPRRSQGARKLGEPGRRRRSKPGSQEEEQAGGGGQYTTTTATTRTPSRQGGRRGRRAPARGHNHRSDDRHPDATILAPNQTQQGSHFPPILHEFPTSEMHLVEPSKPNINQPCTFISPIP